MNKKLISTAALFGANAIIFGAFGAHLLKKHLPIELLNSFETGVRYQMYHALFLLFVATTDLINLKTKKLLLGLVIIGVTLFSGSIYLLSTMPFSDINFKPIGFITPIGGLFLIAAWTLLFIRINTTKP